MRVIVSAAVLLLCVGCGGGDETGKDTAPPDQQPVGDAGAGGAKAERTLEVLRPWTRGSPGEQLLPDEPDNGTLSGSRLKAEWYDFDGTRVFADFYDTELETVCMPGLWSDGKTYCIPVSAATLGYSDEACTDMLGYQSIDKTCPDQSPSYLVLPDDASPCVAASAHLYRLSDTPTTLTQYYSGANGGCSGPFTTGYNSGTYSVTGEVAAAELVEFSREAATDPGRISRQYIVGTDGARLAISPRDRDLDADCSLKADGVHPDRGSCPPTDTRDVVYYSDADCNEPMLHASKDCAKPAFARALEDRSCALGASRYYPVGDAVDTTDVFVGGADVCLSRALSSQYTLYGLGDPVTVKGFSRAHENIARRNLQPIYFSDGEKRFFDNRLYDQAHDVECQVNVLRDGTVVCVPAVPSVSAFYARHR